MTRGWRVALGISTFFAATVLTSCSAGSDAQVGETAVAASAMPSVSSTRVDLLGAGATFPYPLYSRWFNDYALRTNVRINYLSVGSGEGIQQVLAHTVDFGATDIPLSDTELAQSSSPIVHIPTALGAVAITYNLPALKQPLNLTGDVIADIFLGSIVKWNDPRIAELNASQVLPTDRIHVVHRADASGTSYVMSDYLASVSKRWAAGPGRGKEIKWPNGVGAQGNEGVAGEVKQTLASIGYVQVVYARQNRLPVVHVRNRAGNFAPPSAFEIASAAVDVVSDSAKDLRVSLVDAPGEHAYPIATFTWLIVSPVAIGTLKMKQLIAFLRWALTDGREMTNSLGYVELPSETARRVLLQLDQLASEHGATPDTLRPR